MRQRNITDIFIIFLFFLILKIEVIAQQQFFSVTPNVGISVPIFDEGTGINTAINAYYSRSPRIGLEGQFTYNNTRISSAFISGKRSTANTFAGFLGGRVYLLAHTQSKLYLNALLGFYSLKQKINNQNLLNENEFGISLGIFYAYKNKIVAGLSLESPKSAVFKVGYNFVVVPK